MPPIFCREIKKSVQKRRIGKIGKQVPEGTTMRPKFCRDWKKDCEGKTVKKRL